jgi:hypothetical protein
MVAPYCSKFYLYKLEPETRLRLDLNLNLNLNLKLVKGAFDSTGQLELDIGQV